MNNDNLLILRTLFEEESIDVYQLHAATKIPPSTLYVTLENEKRKGNVDRDGLCYRMTEKGESALFYELGKDLMRPSLSFKEVPSKYSGIKVSNDDVSIISKIVQ